MSLQSQFKSKVLLEKIVPLTVIKNEPEIGMDQDIKDEIDIVYHIIPQDLIKSEPIPNNLLESEHLRSAETQIFVQIENTPFLKTEFENVVKTENTSDENLSVEEIQKRKTKLKIDELSYETEKDNRHLKYRCDQCTYRTFHLGNFKRHKLIHLKPESIPYFYCYYCSYKSIQKSYLEVHIFRHFKNEEVPFHCYICDFVTLKRKFIAEHFKKHSEHGSKCEETEYKNKLETYTKKQKRLYNCKKCMFRTYHYEKLNLHELTHKTEVEMDDWHLKYHCDKCSYKTFRYQTLKRHKLIHLKPEEISYFYCYHCSYKSKRKNDLKIHIFRHFNREEVSFHCYICEFVTLKRDLIIEHFKKQTKHHKYEETESQLQTYTKKQKRSFGCKKCTYRTYYCEKLNLHKLSHEADQDDRHLKYRCDKCNYKTFRLQHFKDHEIIHLKPEEIQYFYCYHCSHKAKQKRALTNHILRHFKNEVVKFHCYICNFMTLKRNLITEHIKNHSKVQIKSEINKTT